MITIEKLFDRSANSYDKMEEVRFKQQTIKALEKTKKYLHNNDIVLDFGCATGTKALELAGCVKKIYAIDISYNMIELAKRKAVERKIENVEFTRASIYDQQSMPESLDVITAFNILHLLEDDMEVMKRINGLLKPGGLLITNIPCLGEKMSFRDRFVFSFSVLLMKTGFFPRIHQYKFSDAEHLISTGNFQIIESEKSYARLSGYFIVAKKS